MISPQSVAPERRREAPSFSSFFAIKKWFMILGLLLVILVFAVPVLRLLLLSVLEDGAWSAAHYTHVLREAATWTAVKNTLYTVTGSTLLSLVLGVSMAWTMAYVHLRGKRWIQLFIFLPFIIPSYITTLAWIQFLGKSGPVFSLFGWAPNLYSMGGIIFLLGISHYPLVYLFTVDVFRKIPRELEDAARTAGAGRKHVLMKIVLPLALPGIAGGGLLAFLTNLDNFGIPAFLGIPANVRVLSTYIYEQIAGFGPSAFARAAVLSVLLGTIALAGTLVQWLLLKRSRVTETAVRDTSPRIFLTAWRQRLLEASIWLFLGMTSLVPFLAMGALSLVKAYGLPFRPENLSLKNYHYVFLEDAKTGSALWNSVSLAVVTTVICLVAGTALAYVRYRGGGFLPTLMELFVTIPYALPGTVLALCMIFAWMQPIPGWNPGLYGSIWILLIAYVTRFFVLQVRGSYTALLQVDPSMEEAARVSGAHGWTRWRRILLPLLFPGLAGGALLVFLMVLTELTVSSLLWSTGSETIGVVIFNYEQSGYTTYSTAFASVLVLAILAGGLSFTAFGRQWERKVMKKQ
ncbi:ABC transporter permease [Domibacillus robiginosus]|uniref:ABC transporter permease n=1 Tax=Domibacillus robiginosus TaxID=1071054 RepID=UPI00067BEC34|nr:iron ABC transporter permease [Domibacillus robiginosus]